jgi:outer membrane lipoprotein carrier protein
MRYVITFIVFISLPAWAQADIVEQIEAHYCNSPGIQADFTQTTHIEIMDRDDIKSGTLYFTQDKFRIDYKKPQRQEYIYNGKTLWIYTPRYREVEVYANASDRISREALTFLSGLGELRQSFRIPKVKRTGQDYWLTLIPKSRESHFKKIILKVAQDSYDIRGAELWPKQGNISQYVFAQLDSHAALKPKLFDFKPPRGVEVRHPEF